MATVVPGIAHYEIAHVTLYKVHQRVAKTFQRGRAFLVGDAAHINNPLGGMGMNGGIHDAINLTSRLAEVWHGRKADAELERYDRQRRLVTLEYIRDTVDPEQAQPRVRRRRVQAHPARDRSRRRRDTYAIPRCGVSMIAQPAPRAGAEASRSVSAPRFDRSAPQ